MVPVRISMVQDYNARCKIPLSLAQPLLNLTPKLTSLLPKDCPQPVTIMDCGCSTGSLTTKLIQKFMVGYQGSHVTPPVHVILSDTAGNNWETAFEQMEGLAKQYGREKLTYSAVGHSFYDRLVAPNSLSLVLSSTSLQWTSQTPSGSIFFNCPYNEPNPSLANQQIQLASRDFENFLDNRAVELKSGGILALQIPTKSTEKLELLNRAMEDLVKSGRLGHDFLSSYSFPQIHMNSEQRMEIIQSRNEQWLILESQVDPVPSVFWEQYLSHMETDPRDAAQQYAQTMVDLNIYAYTKGLLANCFGKYLEKSGNGQNNEQEIEQLLNHFYSKVETLIAEKPNPLTMEGWTVIIQKK